MPKSTQDRINEITVELEKVRKLRQDRIRTGREHRHLSELISELRWERLELLQQQSVHGERWKAVEAALQDAQLNV